MHRVDFFARRMPTGNSTAYVRPAPEEDPEATTIEQLVAASLARDYTVDHDCPEYADDAAERAAALANITEMHRLLGVRAERLDSAYEEISRLRAFIDQIRSRILVGGQSEAVRARWVRETLDGAGLLTPAPGVSDTPEATDDH